MITYGKGSQAQLATCHPDLQRLFTVFALECPPEADHSLICGYRGKAEQDKAVADGKSTKPFPSSGHNKLPSRAMDLQPHPMSPDDWKNPYRFWLIQGRLRACAERLRIRLKPAISWDAPHVELAD
jgi:peptidoglycan L-alanyl-D-glutamate endopeptidase CwlK